MPLTPPQTVCTSISVPTENSSKWLTPTSILYWCVTCSSLTMLPSQRIPRQHCRGSSTNSPARVALWPHSLKKTNVITRDVSHTPEIKIGDHTLEVVDKFTYLGSTISMNLGLDSEISQRVGKATGIMSNLTKRAWENKYLTESTKMHIYQASVLNTLLYGSGTWTTYMRQEHRMNSFHLRCFRRILCVKWQNHITNNEILSRAGTPSLYSLHSKGRLRWLRHVHRMDNGRIP